MNLHKEDDFETPTQRQARMIADLEARLQLWNEAYFYLAADRNRILAKLDKLTGTVQREPLQVLPPNP